MKRKISHFFAVAIGSAILAFGLYNIHSQSLITEGGTLGMTLLLQYLFDISPAVSGAILNVLCYGIGIKVLGKNFLIYSVVATVSFSLFYKLFELFPPLFPEISSYPLLASVTGAVFVGIGVGISVRYGGASGGDDALAMAISYKFKIGIQWVYLASDLVVLSLSACYIPLYRLIYSLLTVFISGQIIAFVQNFEKNKKSIK